MRVLYLDCFSGAAGDMILGALIDAGASEENVRGCLNELGIHGWELTTTRSNKRGISSTQVKVRVEADQPPRTYADIKSLLARAELPGRVRSKAERAFRILAEAEAAIHGVPADSVHLHEVGAIDAIVDIVGACAAIEEFIPDTVGASAIATGRGTTRSHHGELPVPAPAVLEILRNTNAVLTDKGDRELITPTGAALLAAYVEDFAPAPPMKVEHIGYGAGTAELEWPNAVRVVVGETESAGQDPLTNVLLEANIDDMSPELLPSVVERLLDAGADDAWITPILMKKGRPAHKLSALVDPIVQHDVERVFFHDTTTFGLRRTQVEKRPLEREWIETNIDGVPMRVKVARDLGHVTTVAPEYEDALRVARETGLPLKEVYARALKEISD